MGFFGGGASVDLASPSAIGSTTPNTGAFTTLSATPPANTTAFNSTGYSLTGTNAQTLLNLSGTWNTTGTPTAVLLNITDTASNASSVLMGMQVGGANRFQFLKDGRLRFNVSGTGILNNSNTGIEFVGDDVGIRQNNSTGAYKVYFANSVGFRLGSNYYLGWSSGVYADNSFGTIDLTIFRDGADVLAQRRTTNAQTFRLYNTFTDASNYERGFMRWATNVLEIGAEAAGTGTQRQLRFPLGTVTASTPLSITQTWNSAGVTFTGFQLNATDTASASGSLLMDLQVGGVSQFTFRKNGIACLRFGFAAGSDVGIECYSSNDSAMSRTVSARCNMLGSISSGLRLSSGHAVSWSSNNGSTADVFQNNDLFILRDTANILAQRNSTNAQIFRLYRTFTDASNYERLGFIATRTTRFAIAAENAGTGAARSLEISFYTSASDPASTDITDGCFSVWKNSGTGTIKLWANDGGTMKSVALA